MLIMCMNALYERSRKILAFYIVVAVSFFTVGCVGPNPSGNEHLLGGRSVCVHTMAPSSRSITSVVSVGNGNGNKSCRDGWEYSTDGVDVLWDQIPLKLSIRRDNITDEILAFYLVV